MSKKPATPEAFTARLVELCLDGQGFPRRRSDRLILLESAAMGFSHPRSYTETEVNDLLRSWVASVGSRLGVDHVAMRRYLVDEGFLTRDSGGKSYSVEPDRGSAGLRGINLIGALARARREREEKKERFTSS